MEHYRVGIIGLGRKALTIDDEAPLRWLTNYEKTPTTHFSAYQAIDRTTIVAVCARSEASLERFYQRTGLKEVRGYTDYRQMLEKEKLDIVSVCTHTPLKAAIVIAAAEGGARGIICEKAMATSLREADQMLEACQKSGTKLLINHPRRYHPTYQKAKEILNEGTIGDLVGLRGGLWTWLLHNGTHLWDIMRFFAGDAVSVCGWLREEDLPDPGGYGVLHFANGAIAFADVGGGQGFQLELLGRNGLIRIDTFTPGLYLEVYEDVYPPDPTRPAYQFRPRKIALRDHWAPEEDFMPPMQAAVGDLLDSIENDREPISSGADGRAALEIGLAFHASHRQGNRPVPLPLADRSLQVISR
ncbi:MAG: Gfo/Idh/MocA family oxidoreductase [Armatimonadetes bacterium]|nr:Gfo/Idh/MocA family oxidoreductase [Armatimonadota bacterium]MDW8121491.1 Gfo/Idh/MocA family oxidoreductase [Armatimonadota bacterium]